MDTIKANAAAGASIDISGKLDKQATYILGTDFSLKTNGYDSGNGLVITNTGILAKKSGASTFAIDSNGNATFKGDITGATGTFAGNVVSSGQIKGTGSTTGTLGTAAVLGQPTGTLVHGVVGYVTTATTGVTGHCTNGAGYGVRGTNTGASGVGVFCDGRFRWGAYTFPSPDGSAQKMLCADGTWSNRAAVWNGSAGSNFTTLSGVQVIRLPMTINGAVYNVLMTL
jgi:hypothetical protein